MTPTIVSHMKQQQISKLVTSGKRIDGRKLTEFRSILIDTGIIEKAEGSSSKET